MSQIETTGAHFASALTNYAVIGREALIVGQQYCRKGSEDLPNRTIIEVTDVADWAISYRVVQSLNGNLRGALRRFEAPYERDARMWVPAQINPATSAQEG